MVSGLKPHAAMSYHMTGLAIESAIKDSVGFADRCRTSSFIDSAELINTCIAGEGFRREALDSNTGIRCDDAALHTRSTTVGTANFDLTPGGAQDFTRLIHGTAVGSISIADHHALLVVFSAADKQACVEIGKTAAHCLHQGRAWADTIDAHESTTTW